MSKNSNYNPKAFEAEIYKKWQSENLGNPETQMKKQKGKSKTNKTHTILMPPPNLTGNLHAGHAFQHFLMNLLSKTARAKGEKNLWFPGVDHAGIQLEGVIDKLIKKGEFDEELKNYKEEENS